MSSKHFLPRSWRFPALGALIVIQIITFPRLGQPQAGVSDASASHRQFVGEKALAHRAKELRYENAGGEKASSTLWRGYIWQSLPTENMSGPDPDPVSQAYQANGWRPIFIDSRFRLNNGATLLLSRLGELENQAIDPRPFKLDALSKSLEKLAKSRHALSSADPEFKDIRAESLSDNTQVGPPSAAGQFSAPEAERTSLAALARSYEESFLAASEADIRLTAAFFMFTREMNPFLPNEEYLKTASGEVPMSGLLKELEPSTFHYEALVSAYHRYKALAAKGAQQYVAMPSKVHSGETGNHIRNLQKRLQQEGFFSANITGVYDLETERAVKDFQAAHMIDRDGAVGRLTTQWLNVPFQQKAQMIAMAMKAIRQSPSRAHSRFIRINIPQFTLEYYKDGQLQEAHRIVVGKASGKKVKFRGKMVGENQTPTLSSAIEQIILNPRWYVSDRIRLELNAAAKSDPEWFAKHGYVSMHSQHPWGEHRLFQSPGPKNALGRVKFEFSNPYAVYLHDTPQKQLFARTRRDFSHGCIRVDKATELAEKLLRDDTNPYAEKVQTVLTGERQVFLKLQQPVPISIEYIPVITDDKAQVVFAGDPYEILVEDESRNG